MPQWVVAMAHDQGREARCDGLIFGTLRLTESAPLPRFRLVAVRQGRLKLAPMCSAARPVCKDNYDKLELPSGITKHTQFVHDVADSAEGKGMIFEVATCGLEEPHFALRGPP